MRPGQPSAALIVSEHAAIREAIATTSPPLDTRQISGPRHALTGVVHEAQIILGVGKAVVGSFAIPRHSCSIVLRKFDERSGS